MRSIDETLSMSPDQNPSLDDLTDENACICCHNVSEVRKPVVVDPTAVAVKMQNAAVAAASVVKAAKTVAAEVNKSHLK